MTSHALQIFDGIDQDRCVILTLRHAYMTFDAVRTGHRCIITPASRAKSEIAPNRVPPQKMDKGAEGSPRKRLEVYCLTPATQTSRSDIQETASGIRRVYISFLCSYAPSSGGWPLVTHHVEKKAFLHSPGCCIVCRFA